MDDLNRALSLVNEVEVRTKCHAHCQRGILYRKLDNLDAARSDFEAAAQLGSKFAREQVIFLNIPPIGLSTYDIIFFQLVEINPFAALCNQMLRQAFDQLK